MGSRRTSLLVLVIVLAIAAQFLSGCISVEKKEYHFKLNADGTGEGTIRYVNIVSGDDDGKDVSFKDFAELVTDYLEGDKFEEDHPSFHVTSKRLIEENKQLIGEVKFTFASADSAGFLHRAKCDCCPVLYFIKTDVNNETVSETSGKLMENVASSPFIEWEPGTKDFTVKSTVSEDLSNTHSMLAHYKSWVAKK